MQYDLTLNSTFQPVLDDKETVLWAGRPHFWLYLSSGLVLLAFGIMWGAFDYFAFIRTMRVKDAPFLVPFFVIHLFPFYGSILNMLRLWMGYRNAMYAVTNRRVIMRGGVWGIDYKSVDFDRIADMTVTVNPLEKVVGAGSIVFNTGRTNSKGYAINDRFIGIDDPYEVFRHIKQVSLDAKTDWDYPNKLRPAENPGYNTTLVDK